jgi:hypothetical protein
VRKQSKLCSCRRWALRFGAARSRAAVPGWGRAAGISGPGLGVGTWTETGRRGSGGSGGRSSGGSGRLRAADGTQPRPADQSGSYM